MANELASTGETLAELEERSAMKGDVTGFAYLRDVLNERKKYDAKKVAIAKILINFEMPRLNSVDAVQRSVEMTNEEWIAELERIGK